MSDCVATSAAMPPRRSAWSSTERMRIGWPIWTLQLNDAAAHRNRHSLGPVVCVELFRDVFDVALHGLFGDAQQLADLAIAEPLGHPLEDGQLALAQRLVADMLGEARRDIRRDLLFAAVHPPDDAGELAG